MYNILHKNLRKKWLESQAARYKIVQKKGHYNKWMLYIVMKSESSDYGGVLPKLGVPAQDMPKAVYMMALAKIDDRDRKESLREYYGLE